MIPTRIQFKIEKQISALLGPTTPVEVQDSRLLHTEDAYTLLMIKADNTWFDITLENEKTDKETVEVVISA